MDSTVDISEPQDIFSEVSQNSSTPAILTRSNTQETDDGSLDKRSDKSDIIFEEELAASSSSERHIHHQNSFEDNQQLELPDDELSLNGVEPHGRSKKSRSQHNSSSGSSNRSKSSRKSSENLSRSDSPHLNSTRTSSGLPVSKSISMPSNSRSSSSSAGLICKASGSNLSSAHDPLEFSAVQGSLFDLRPPIDAIAGVESLTEPSYVYGLSHSSSQIISGSPLLDALGDKSSWSSSSLRNRSTDEPGVVRAKKTSWYNALYPSYKSRSEDFKKIFSTLPATERLIVEYSCAIQKDILVHGRLYATVNYLCFYANIFRWETSVAIKWKDVNGLTKEKTALVIPNAIQVTTDSDKHFFTSFAGRDKTYMMLFKLWQNALLDQPATAGDIWRWVHSVYGDELGLTSDDELDYVSPFVTPDGSASGSKVTSTSHSPPSTKKPFLHSTMSVPANLKDAAEQLSAETSASFARPCLVRQIGSIVEESGCPQPLVDDLQDGGHHQQPQLSHAVSAPTSVASTDLLSVDRHLRKIKKTRHLSDNSDNSEDSDISGPRNHKHLTIGQILGSDFAASVDQPEIQLTLDKWKSTVEGRELTNEVYPISVDQLFTLLFTNSKFYLDFHANRKTFDMNQTPWTSKPGNEVEKIREVSFTLTLTHPMGPKHSQVVETQVMHPDSQPGRQYIIDVEVANGGIPYADSFYVTSQFYLSRVSDNESRLCVIAAVKYKKTVWGLVKTFIEKNTWSGLEDFYSNLARALHVETATPRPGSGKNRRKPKTRKTGKLLVQNPVNLDDLNDDDCNEDGENGPDFNSNLRLTSNHVSNVNYFGNNTSRHINPNNIANQHGGPKNSDSIVKVIFILLTGLLLANSLLFYKMWDLETKLGNPLTNLEEVLIAASKDPRSIDRETWLKILQRQEAAHQLELQKWHDLLGTAASLLKQTEESLSNLQKSIHPIALSKLKGLLDLRNELTSTLGGEKEGDPSNDDILTHYNEKDQSEL